MDYVDGYLSTSVATNYIYSPNRRSPNEDETPSPPTPATPHTWINPSRCNNKKITSMLINLATAEAVAEAAIGNLKGAIRIT